jgi:phosphoglycerol transferase
VGYGVTLTACLLITTWALQLWRLKLSVPLWFTGDALVYQAFIKGVADHGWHRNNGDLGAPWVLEVHDFPMPDHLHFLVQRLLSLLDPRPGVVFNLYYLLTFPLTAAAALFALRRCGVGYPVAVVASLLFTFLPYHFMRGEHHHLAAYYVIPLTVLVVVRVYLGPLPLFRLELCRWHFLSGQTLGALLVCVLTGLAGVYYAFFACFLLGVAGVASSCFRRRLAPLGVAAVLAAVIIGTVAVGLSPSARYRREQGPNPSAEDCRRHHGESEEYGLKLTQLLLPISGHRLPWASALRARYDSPPTPLVNENSCASLGAVGAVGFLWLLCRLLLRGRKPGRLKLMDALAVLVMSATLLATLGGFGTVFALLVSPAIRCYNRMSVYIGFFALFAVALLLDRLCRRMAAARAGAWVSWVLLGGVLTLGILDEVIAGFVPPYATTQEQYRIVKEFVGRIEAAVPAGSMVYQLPYVPFNTASPERMGLSDHLRPYLVSRSLRWSHGAMRGRDSEAWQSHLAQEPLAEQIRVLAETGFAGIYVDREGFADRARETEAELTRLLGVTPLLSADNRMSFFPLANYTREYRRRFPAQEWEARRQRALEPVRFHWQNGFDPEEGATPKERWHWCASSGDLVIINRLPVSRTITLKMKCVGPAAPLRIRGDLLNLDAGPEARGVVVIDKRLEVPPGSHTLRFQCDGPPAPFPDWKEHPRVFRVINCQFREEG